MRTIDQRTGLELLSHDECIQLLRRTRLGRLAMVVDGMPTIWPVNYYVRDENTIVFRTTRAASSPPWRLLFRLPSRSTVRRRTTAGGASW